jgi:hypothetical protein
LDTCDTKSAQLIAEVDAFVDGVETFAKQSGLTKRSEMQLWGYIGSCVEAAACQVIEKNAFLGGVLPSGGINPGAALATGTSALSDAATNALLMAGSQPGLSYTDPEGATTTLEEDAGTPWHQRLLQSFQDPQQMAYTMGAGGAGALGGLLMSLINKNQRKHWLRNALLGGGLGLLAYPAMNTLAGQTGADSQ